jgi:hypothetical protein
LADRPSFDEQIGHLRREIDSLVQRANGPDPEPSVAPTAAQLAAYPDELVRLFMDWWAIANPTLSTVRYEFWHSELRRRSEERLTSQLMEATDEMKSMTGQIKRWTVVNGALAAAVLVVAVITLALN